MAQTLSNYFDMNQPKPKLGRKTKDAELIGIEVELEGVSLPPAKFPWVQHEDGSLKNNGIEYTVLTYSNHALARLQSLFANLRPNISPRCSVHVHINALDMSLDNIKTMMLYYMVFEKALYQYSGKRWSNIFCVPLNSWMFTLTLVESIPNLTTWSKYTGLNLGSVHTHGTIEFRQMTGNTNPLYINNWIQLIVALKKYAMSKTFAETRETIFDMNSSSSYWWLATEIFGPLNGSLMYANFQQDVESCVSHTKLCMTDIKTLKHYLKGEDSCAVS